MAPVVQPIIKPETCSKASRPCALMSALLPRVPAYTPQGLVPDSWLCRIRWRLLHGRWIGERCMARRRLKVFFDGGCRPNPGRMEAGVVLRGVPHVFDDLGLGTNNDAEWLALIRAMELTQSLGLSDIEYVGDAREVIGQANRALASGKAPAGPFHQHAAAFLSLAGRVPPARIRWIKRAQNLAGIALAARYPR